MIRLLVDTKTMEMERILLAKKLLIYVVQVNIRLDLVEKNLKNYSQMVSQQVLKKCKNT